MKRGPVEGEWERGTEMFWNLGCSPSFLDISEDFLSRCCPDTTLGARGHWRKVRSQPSGTFCLVIPVFG